MHNPVKPAARGADWFPLVGVLWKLFPLLSLTPGCLIDILLFTWADISKTRSEKCRIWIHYPFIYNTMSQINQLMSFNWGKWYKSNPKSYTNLIWSYTISKLKCFIVLNKLLKRICNKSPRCAITAFRKTKGYFTVKCNFTKQMPLISRV